MTLTRKQARFAEKMQSGFSADVLKEPRVRYYMIGRNHKNVVRSLDDVVLAYLDHETGEWVDSSHTLFNDITGVGGDACTHEISNQEAQAWVAKHLPALSVEWV